MSEPGLNPTSESGSDGSEELTLAQGQKPGAGQPPPDQAGPVASSPPRQTRDDDGDTDDADDDGEAEAAGKSMAARTLSGLGSVAQGAGSAAKQGVQLARRYPRASMASGLSAAILSGVMVLQPGKGTNDTTAAIPSTAAPSQTAPADPRAASTANEPAGKPDNSVPGPGPAAAGDDPPIVFEGQDAKAGTAVPEKSPPEPSPVVGAGEKAAPAPAGADPGADPPITGLAAAADHRPAPAPTEAIPLPPVGDPVKLTAGEGPAALPPLGTDPAPVVLGAGEKLADPAPAPAPPILELAAADTKPGTPPGPASAAIPAASALAGASAGAALSASAPAPAPVVGPDKGPKAQVPDPKASAPAPAPAPVSAPAPSPVVDHAPAPQAAPAPAPDVKAAGPGAGSLVKDTAGGTAKAAAIAGGVGLAAGAGAGAAVAALSKGNDSKGQVQAQGQGKEKDQARPAPAPSAPASTPSPAPSPVTAAAEPKPLDLHSAPAADLPTLHPTGDPGPNPIADTPQDQPKPSASVEEAAPGPRDELAKQGWVPIKHSAGETVHDVQRDLPGPDEEPSPSAARTGTTDPNAHADKDQSFDVQAPPGRAAAAGAAIAAGAGGRAIAAADDPALTRSSRSEGKLDTVLHKVEKNENFWTISRMYYNSGRYYKALWKANEDKVPEIDKLYRNTVIRIPPPEDLDAALILPPGTRSPNAAGEKLAANDADADHSTSGRSRPADGVPIRRSSRSDAELNLPVSDVATEEADGATRAARRSSRSTSSTRDDRDDDREPEIRPRDAVTRPIYKVRQYDTLRTIARDTLGDSRRASEILDLNRDLIDDPGQLIVGQILQLPEDARPARARARR